MTDDLCFTPATRLVALYQKRTVSPLDVTRAKERFGFSAHTSLRDGLAKTVVWYLENRS